MKNTIAARVARVEYLQYFNTIVLAAHVGIPIALWTLVFFS